MKIGIVAPFETRTLAAVMGGHVDAMPRGYLGAPVITTLALALLNKGHRVSIYTTDNELLPAQQTPLVFHKGALTIYFCPSRARSFVPQHRRLGRMLDFFRFERQGLGQAIRDDAPDVVHGHWAYEFGWAAIDSGLPHVVTFHDAPLKVLRYMPTLYRAGRYLMARRTVREAAIVTTVSPYMQKAIETWSKRRPELVPNMLSGDVFDAITDPAARDLARPVIAMVLNGWGRLKNPIPAMRSFALIRARIPDAQLHLYGIDFGPGESAEQWCVKNHMTTGITFYGSLPADKLKIHLARATLLLHPSLEESFGMVIAESMALGLPVVGGCRSGAVPWLLDNGNAGVLTDVTDPTQIAACVLALFADAALFVRISQAARENAESRFSAKAVANMYESYYLQSIRLHQSKTRTS
jgi:L-malate glycosyltransferase